MEQILKEIARERKHQDEKWGGPKHDDIHHPYSWCVVITSYLSKSVGFFITETGTEDSRYKTFRFNMVKVAALALAAIEAVDRKIENGKN